jgi:hypothetical protein
VGSTLDSPRWSPGPGDAGDRRDTAARRALWLEGLVFLALIALSRLLVLASVYGATGGQEFTDDIEIYLDMLASPLAILTGDPVTFGQYPPLLPVLLLPLGAPLRQVLPDFLAMRLVFLGYELLAWPLVWFILCRSVHRVRGRRILALAYLACPMTWVTSVVMCQEDILGLLCSAAIVAALVTDRRLTAVLLCSLGACAVKIFFLVPLAALVLAPHGRPCLAALVRRGAFGALPVGLVYGSAVLGALGNDGGVPLAEFNPPVMMCVSIWTALSTLGEIPPRVMEFAAVALCLLSTAAVLVLARAHQAHLAGTDLARLGCSLLFLVLACFHHVNPEYFALTVPLLLVMFHPRRTAAVLVGGLSLPWAVNLLYGVSEPAAASEGGRRVFVETYRAVTSVDPQLAHHLVLWLSVLFAGGLAIASTREMLRRLERIPTASRPVPEPLRHRRATASLAAQLF